MKETPAVFAVALLYVAVGLGGLVTHFPPHWQAEDILIEFTELVALNCGVFLLRRKNWARWLALAWMALHVAISFPVISQMAIHLSFLIVIAWALFRPTTQNYFVSRSRDGS
jgi:hypothetical protein